ncbi:MAG: hypothetical protein Kow0069_33520 [Promethearchaeota archaeon]
MEPFGDRAWVSPANFDEAFRKAHSPRLPKLVVVRDSTLREGEETPGVAFTLEEKLEIAEALEELGVRLVDVGYVGVVREHWELAAALKERGFHLETHCHLGTNPAKWAGELEKVADARIDSVGVGVVLNQWQLDLFAGNVGGSRAQRVTPQVMLELVRPTVRRVKRAGLNPHLDLVDATRTDPALLAAATSKALKAGASAVFVYDSVGACYPAAFRAILSPLVDLTAERGVPFGVHVHDDFGLATASTLAGVEEGATVVDLVANKLGDRAGNASLEEVVVALELLYGVDTGLRLNKLHDFCKLVERLSGVPLPPNKAVVGCNAFLHESELHARSVLEAAGGGGRPPPHWMCFTPYRPELVGQEERVVFGPTTLHGDALAALASSAGLTGWEASAGQVLDELRGIIARKKFATLEEVLGAIRRAGGRGPGASDPTLE